MQAVRHYLLAVQYFTRIPIVGKLAAWVGWHPSMLAAALGHFPGIGCLVGAWAVLVYGALEWALGPGRVDTVLVAAVGATAATVWLTGGLHEDGLADVADGLGGSWQRERALVIMKDSRIGAFGAMALLLVLLGKVALLLCLGGYGTKVVAVSLWAAHAFSRLCPLWLVYALPYVGDSSRSKSRSLLGRITAPTLFTAILWCAAPLLLLYCLHSVAVLLTALAGSLLATAYLYWRFQRRLQGYTGDCLGAVQQTAEIGFYVGAAVALAR